MYLLYLDESGNENDPADRFFVLAGISLFERQTYFLTQRIEALQERFFPNHPPIPVHASEIRAGRGFWRSIPWETRRSILEDFAGALRETEPRGRVLFAARESRLLQAADFVAHATWLLYERRDPSLFRHIRHCFDQRNGRLDGLVHVRPDGDRTPCHCPACASRRDGDSVEAWLQDADAMNSDAAPA